MKWKIFVESGYGYLEFKLCEFLKCTPYELGKKRDENPDGIRFLEDSFVYQWNEQEKARKEAERKSRHRR